MCLIVQGMSFQTLFSVEDTLKNVVTIKIKLFFVHAMKVSAVQNIFQKQE